MEDAQHTLAMPPDADIGHYRLQLLQRFRNTSLHQLTAQIATDGSQKLPQRILDPIRARLAEHLPIAHHALVVAGWMRYLMGRDEHYRTLTINDPMAAELQSAAALAGSDPGQMVDRMLEFSRIFGHDLPKNQFFVRSLKTALHSLSDEGVLATLATSTLKKEQ